MQGLKMEKVLIMDKQKSKLSMMGRGTIMLLINLYRFTIIQNAATKEMKIPPTHQRATNPPI